MSPFAANSSFIADVIDKFQTMFGPRPSTPLTQDELQALCNLISSSQESAQDYQPFLAAAVFLLSTAMVGNIITSARYLYNYKEPELIPGGGPDDQAIIDDDIAYGNTVINLMAVSVVAIGFYLGV